MTITKEIIERAFLKSEAMREFFYKQKGCLNAYIDKNGYIVYASDEWTNVLGWTEKELTDVPFFEFIHPEDRKESAELYEDYTENGKIMERDEFVNRYRAKDGSYVSLLWTPFAVGELDDELYATTATVKQQDNA